MRIIEVTEAAGSGTFGIVRTLANELAGAGHQVLVALGRRPETADDVTPLFVPGVTVVALAWERRRPRSQIVAARTLRHLAREWRPDVVHLHSAFAGVVGA